jgi:hypothetical protein
MARSAMSERNAGPKVVEVPRKVEVAFLVPGVGSVKEIYDLGCAEDMLCWTLNERLTKAILIGLKVTESVLVRPSVERQMRRSRAGMKPYVDERVSEYRGRIARGAARGA